MNGINVNKKTNNALTQWLDNVCVKMTDSDFDTCHARRCGGSVGVRDRFKIEYLKYLDVFENGEEDEFYI